MLFKILRKNKLYYLAASLSNAGTSVSAAAASTDDIGGVNNNDEEEEVVDGVGKENSSSDTHS